MNLKNKVDKKSLELFKQQQLDRLKQAMVEVSANAIGSMLLRVAEGKGLNDKPMKPYSKAYAKKKKEESGRDVSIRDLTSARDPQMLKSINLVDIRQEEGKIVGIVAPTGNRNQLVALYNQKIAPWFGWSPKDKIEITESIKEQITKVSQA